MTASLAIGDSRNEMDTKWHPMFIVSAFFHLAIFSAILFFPESRPTRDIKGIVYEVNLVEMPSGQTADAAPESGQPNVGRARRSR